MRCARSAQAHCTLHAALGARRDVSGGPLQQVDQKHARVEAAAARRDARRARHRHQARVDRALDRVLAVGDGAHRHAAQGLPPERVEVGAHEGVGLKPQEAAELGEERGDVDECPAAVDPLLGDHRGLLGTRFLGARFADSRPPAAGAL